MSPRNGSSGRASSVRVAVSTKILGMSPRNESSGRGPRCNVSVAAKILGMRPRDESSVRVLEAWALRKSLG